MKDRAISRRRFLGYLAAGAGASILAACTPKATPTPVVIEKVVTKEVAKEVTKEVTKEVVKARPKLTMWVDMNFFSAGAEGLYKAQAMDYAQKMGFDLEYVQEAWDVMGPRENAARESKTLPDVLWCPVENAAATRRAGQTTDLTDVVAECNKNMGGFTKGMLAAVTADGKQCAVPWSSSTEMFYSRTDLLDKAGLKVPNTWDEAFAAARKVNNPPAVWGLGLAAGGTNNGDCENQMAALLWAFGTSVYAQDGKTIALDSPATRQVLTMLQQAFKDGLLPQDVVTWDSTGNNKGYQSGKLAFIQNTGSVATWLKQNDPDLLAATALTAPPAGPSGRFVQAAGYCLLVPNYTKNPDLAKGLVKWLSDPTPYQAIMTLFGGFQVPVYAGLTSLKMWEDRLLKPLAESMPYTFLPGYPGPVTDAALQAYNERTLAKMCVRVLADKWTPDQAVAEAVQKVKAINDKFK